MLISQNTDYSFDTLIVTLVSIGPVSLPAVAGGGSPPGPWVPEEVTLEGLVGFVKLADNWHLYVSELGVIQTTQREVPDVARKYDLLAEIHFDGAAKRYAKTGYTGRVKYFDPRVLSFGDLMREIPVQPGEFRISSMRLELNNADGAITTLRQTKAWMNRPVHFLFGDASLGEEDFEVVGTGRIDAWSGSAQSFTFEATDVMLRKFESNLTPTRVVTNILFPTLLDSETRELIPLVIGVVSSAGTTGQGAIRAQLIDVATFKYIVAQGVVTVLNVYKDGLLVAPSSYSISEGTFGSGATLSSATFISFTVDVSSSEITCDIDGLKDADGTMKNPARIWKRVLLESGFAPGDIDDASFLAAEITLDVRNIRGVFAEVDKSVTLRTIANKMAESFNMITIITKGGRIGVTVPEPQKTAAADLYLIDESKVVQGSFRMQGPDFVASAIDGDFKFNPFTGAFEDRVIFEDVQARASLGDEQLRISASLFYVTDPSSAGSILSDRLFFAQERRTIVEILADPDIYRRVDVGQDVRLTHFAGGFVEQIFRVVALGLTVQEDTVLCNLRLVDMTEVGRLALTEQWKTLMGDFTVSKFKSDVHFITFEGTDIAVGMR